MSTHSSKCVEVDSSGRSKITFGEYKKRREAERQKEKEITQISREVIAKGHYIPRKGNKRGGKRVKARQQVAKIYKKIQETTAPIEKAKLLQLVEHCRQDYGKPFQQAGGNAKRQ